MTKLLETFLLLAILLPQNLWAQEVSVEHGRFQKGDNPAWNAFALDDSAWREVSLMDQPWESLGLESANGVGWYRIHVVIPSSLKKGIVEDGMQIWSRDLWRQKDIPTDALYVIPPHGVLYVKVK